MESKINIEFSQEVLQQYTGKNPFKNPISEFVYLRTYSRWLETEKRRETWLETCVRCVKYSYTLYTGHKNSQQLLPEAEMFLDNMFNVRQLPSGRTMWVGGTEIIKMIPSANFNCAFTNFDGIEAFRDLFYLLMVGCGVGFSTEKHIIKDLPLFRNNVSLKVKPYEWCGCPASPEETKLTGETHLDGTTHVLMEVGDSREGWSNGLFDFFKLMTETDVNAITVDVDYVRPSGSRLKRFGGKASGPGPYTEMITKIHKVISKAPVVDGNWVRLRPIDVLDICNIIGENVVAGGVRRTAEIALMDADSNEMIEAKVNYWANPETSHRGMSNNSIAFWEKPTLEYLKELIETIKKSWEPGFVNSLAASLRRPWFAGFNPCVEILLPNKGFCNLVTHFLPAFIKYTEDGRAYIDMDGLIAAIKIGVRHACRLTNVDIELEKWDKNQKRDRLLGISLTGGEDAFEACQIDRELEYGDDGRVVLVSLEGRRVPMIIDDLKHRLNSEANEEASNYANELRIPTPLLVCCVKPEGTQSLLGSDGPVSSGANKSFAPYQIRRVRINSFDALAQTVRKQGYKIYPEVGNGFTSQEFDALTEEHQNKVLDSVKTWVVEFVVKTKAKTKAADEPAIDALKRYFSYQNNWTDHNTSITIQVGDEEWNDVVEMLHDRWDEYIGVSFQAKENNTYDLAPLEAISEEEYNIRINRCPEIDLGLLNAIENGKSSADDELEASCSTGACPIR